MSIAMIVAGIGAVAAFIATIAIYATAYSSANPGITPQLQSILGTVFVGSIVMGVLGYLVLVQMQALHKRFSILFLAFISILLASLSFGWSS